MKISMDKLREGFAKQGYIAAEETVVTVYLALTLGKPLLMEGPPGVGKTEIAKVLAGIFNTELIRLQCYEGLDENKALYEWNYQRQLIKIQISRDNKDAGAVENDIFSREYLLERPLLKAIQAEKMPVLLIDEIDKTDEEFEAFLFEVLSDFQVSIPELGTIKARNIPIVVLTSNGERELSDGLKRRCVYLYLDYPGIDTEISIINARVPGVGEKLTGDIARAVHYIRGLDIKKKPSIAETLDWARALIALNADRINPELLKHTMNIILKNKDDINLVMEFLDNDELFKYINGEQNKKKGR